MRVLKLSVITISRCAAQCARYCQAAGLYRASSLQKHTLDGAAAETAAGFVDDRELAWRRGALRLLELDPRGAVRIELHARSLLRLAVAQP